MSTSQLILNHLINWSKKARRKLTKRRIVMLIALKPHLRSTGKVEPQKPSLTWRREVWDLARHPTAKFFGTVKETFPIKHCDLIFTQQKNIENVSFKIFKQPAQLEYHFLKTAKGHPGRIPKIFHKREKFFKTLRHVAKV